jgi:hypothetical protein
VNNSEGIWGATDSLEDVSAMRGIFPAAIRASEILDVDPGLRATWAEFVTNLPPLPVDENGAWVVAHPPVLHGKPNTPDLTPAVYFDLCTASTEDAAMMKSANATYDAIQNRLRQAPSTNAPEDGAENSPDESNGTSGFNSTEPVSVLSSIAAAAAHLGRGEDLRYILPNQIRCLRPQKDFCDWTGSGETGAMRNRLTLREGPGAIGAERLGRITRGVNDGLLQSAPLAPGGDPVISVFPAWPKEWDSEFTLLARGAFVVTSEMQKGRILFVDLLSQAGGECRLKNPWGKNEVTLYRGGKKSENLSGGLLKFETTKGGRIVVVPAGTSPGDSRLVVN